MSSSSSAGREPERAPGRRLDRAVQQRAVVVVEHQHAHRVADRGHGGQRAAASRYTAPASETT
jgi:hypothetical protein